MLTSARPNWTKSSKPTANRSRAVTIRSANIEAIYPLTPVQEGILFHTLFAPDSQLYFQQYVCSIEGDLDPGAFRESWQWVIDRHPPLRSLIAWEGREQPLQIVRSRVQADWREDDWRSLEAEVQSRRIAEFLQEDRARGLQLDVAPLLRFALFRTGDALFRFVWSHHHIVVDGWSLGIVLSEVFHRYATIVSGDQAEPPPPPVFRDYVAWLRGRDLAPAEEFWRGALKGFDQATALPIESGLRSGRSDTVRRRCVCPHPPPLKSTVSPAPRGSRSTLCSEEHGPWCLLAIAAAMTWSSGRHCPAVLPSSQGPSTRSGSSSTLSPFG